MTVNELIEKLNKINDKNKEIVFPHWCGTTESGDTISISDVKEYIDCVVVLD